MTEKEIILDCINNRKPLPKSLQIKILKLTLKEIQEKGWCCGLCFMLDTIICNLIFGEYNYSLLDYDDLSIIIPSFNINNALGRTGLVNIGYWWNTNEEGNIQRIKFLKRMIKELKRNKFKRFLSKFF